MSVKNDKRIRRHKKIRKVLHGTALRPRLCVARSNQHIYAQLINDETAKVLMSVSDKDVKAKPASAKGYGVVNKNRLSASHGKTVLVFLTY